MKEKIGAPRYPLRLGRRMLPSDAFFWYAEAATPQLRPLVAGLFMLDRSPDPKRFRASIARLVACVPRFRQRVVTTPFSFLLPEWREDPGFDLKYHLRELLLPAPSNERHLFDIASALFATPLDHLRPLWEAYLIDGLEGGRAAYFLKMHHSIMDGAGSIALFDTMTQAQRDDAVLPLPRSRPTKARISAPDLLTPLGAATAAVADVLRDVGRLARDPEELAAQVRRTARQAGVLLRDALSERIEDPLSARATGIGRRLDGMTLPMTRIRMLKDAMGVPLNDLVLVAVAGALGRYHHHRGIDLREVPCLIPMSLRDAGDRHRLGNHTGAFRILLPLHERSLTQRLARIHAQTRAAKEGQQGAVYGALMKLVNVIPAAVFRAAATSISGKVHLICSNVPGPPEHRYLGGARIDAVLPFAPVMLGTPLSIALMSYGDQLGFGIDSDPAAISDPERIRHFLELEFDEIERQSRPRQPALAAKRAGGGGAGRRLERQRRTTMPRLVSGASARR